MGDPLTKATFIQHVRAAMQATGHPQSQFAGHNFRIGATTTAASAGIEDSIIHILGRWNSLAFLQYIRTPQTTTGKFFKIHISLSFEIENNETKYYDTYYCSYLIAIASS